MSSRFGMRTYGSRQSPKACNSANLQFDSLFSDKNRPSAAKSAGTVHRWGKTSFTSLRNVHLNGQKEQHSEEVECSKKMKLSDNDDDPFSFDNDSDVSTAVKLEHIAAPQLDGVKALLQPRPNKFFKSGSRRGGGSSSSNSKFDSLLGIQKPLSPVMDRENIDTSKQMHLDDFTSRYNSFQQTNDSVSLDNVNLPASFKYDSMHVNRSHKTYSSPNNVRTIQSGPIGSSQSDNSQSCQNSVACSQSESMFMNSSSSSEDSCEEITVKKLPKRIFKTYPSKVDEKQEVEVENNSHTSQRGLPITIPDGVQSITLQEHSVTNTTQTILESIQADFDLSPQQLEPTIPFTLPSKITLGMIQADFDNLLEDDDDIMTEPSVVTSVNQCGVSPLVYQSENLSHVNEAQHEPVKSGSVDLLDIADEGNSPPESVESDDRPLESLGDTQEIIEKEIVQEVVQKPKANTIFKNTRKIFNSPKKAGERWALYKHTLFCEDVEEGEDEPSSHQSSSQPTTTTSDDFDFDDDHEERVSPPVNRVDRRPATLTRVTTWPLRANQAPVTSVKCPKNDKELYKVVRNVKQAHQVHEIGETQEFNDDIDYLLESLEPTNSVGTRCLSILGLTTKCMVPAFRMHLRAHGTLSKVFSALQNAPSDPNLALCTASAMFVLSQDRLNMDLERESLELMLQLLESDTVTEDMVEEPKTAEDGREFERNKQKIRDLCNELQRKGHAKMLDLDNISAATLAMESLLSLTSRKAGEWFKEELRELGGLDHILRTVSDCVERISDSIETLDDVTVDNLKKFDRCLRVLENVTFMNTENQSYLLSFNNGQFTDCSGRVLRLLIRDIHHHPPTDPPDKDSVNALLVLCLLSIFKVYLNITHENAVGCKKVGEIPYAISTVLSCVMYLPSHIPREQRFDLLVLSLGMLINLVEHCDLNRKKLLEAEAPNVQVPWAQDESSSAVQALVNLFLYHVESARVEEAKTDSLLDGKKEDDNKNETNAGPQPIAAEDMEETLKKALQKAGRHMEDSMVAANTALLLGCAIQDNKEEAKRICSYLPNNSFQTMVQILNKFLDFMSLTTAVSSTGVNTIERVIKILEAS